MSTRTHLSIGEVLSLLSDDFPDLTITKIRFLESQGLISPERTASGYRKFYDFDIDRLRWILRQQRENFLPLKVIRDRLDGPDGGRPELPTDVPEQAELDLARDPGRADPPPVWMADHAAAQDRSVRAVHEPTATSTAARSAHRDPERPAVTDAPRPVVTDEPLTTSADTTAPEVQPSPGSQGRKTPKHKSKPRATSAAPSTPVDRSEDSPRSPQSRTEAPTAMSAPPPTDPPAPTGTTDLSDVSMNRAELLGASKLDERQLTELESFGIVVSSGDPDEPFYGAEALVCARQAATFLELGMEPRHLRAFKVAADREAGLYEQLTAPLLRQRNPAARAEATRIVDRLISAGAAIHSSLLMQSMRSRSHPGR